MRERVTAGIIAPYWEFWESVVEEDPHEAHRSMIATATQTVSEHATISWSVGATQLASSLSAVDVIVVVVTMAAPPEDIRKFLESRRASSVLIWSAYPSPDISEPFTHESITLRGGTVGGSMVAASLTRVGIPLDVVAGVPESREVAAALRSVVAASRVRQARLSVIGDPLPGYDFMAPPAAELSRVGVELVRHSSEEFAASVAAAVPQASQERVVGKSGDDDIASQYVVALERLAEDDRSAAGTLNCHSRVLRGGSSLGGIAPCFALGTLTSSGRPWTCTGDVNTSIAMLLVASLGHPTMYHEMEAIDEIRDEVILANSGEHDARFAAVNPPVVDVNPWFPDSRSPILRFQIAPGPASIVAVVSRGDTLRVVLAEGTFEDRDTSQTGTMSAAFRFAQSDHTSASSAWAEWVRAGAGHHACATDARLRDELAAVCRHLQLEMIVVA